MVLQGSSYGWHYIPPPQKSHVELLTPGTSDCDLLGRWIPYRGNQVKMRSFGWVLIKYDRCPYNMEKSRHRPKQREVTPHEDGKPGWADDSANRGVPEVASSAPASQGEAGDRLALGHLTLTAGLQDSGTVRGCWGHRVCGICQGRPRTLISAARLPALCLTEPFCRSPWTSVPQVTPWTVSLCRPHARVTLRARLP